MKIKKQEKENILSHLKHLRDWRIGESNKPPNKNSTEALKKAIDILERV